MLIRPSPPRNQHRALRPALAYRTPGDEAGCADVRVDDVGHVRDMASGDGYWQCGGSVPDYQQVGVGVDFVLKAVGDNAFDLDEPHVVLRLLCVGNRDSAWLRRVCMSDDAAMCTSLCRHVPGFVEFRHSGDLHYVADGWRRLERVGHVRYAGLVLHQQASRLDKGDLTLYVVGAFRRRRAVSICGEIGGRAYRRVAWRPRRRKAEHGERGGQASVQASHRE